MHVEARDGGCRLWVHAPSVGERIGLGNSLDACLRDRGEALCLGEVWQPLLTPALHKATSFSAGPRLMPSAFGSTSLPTVS